MSYYFSYRTPEILSHIRNNPAFSREKLVKLYPEHKFHATMLYVVGDYEPQLESVFAENLSAKIKNIEIWNNSSTGGNCYLVAVLDTLDNPKLEETYKRLQTEINYADPRNSFMPHISLQKAKSLDDLAQPEELHFLVGKSVLLEHFQCHDLGQKNAHIENMTTPSINTNVNTNTTTQRFKSSV